VTNDERPYRELVASAERLQAFMRHSPALVFMKDSEGRYVYVNSRLEETFGIRLADIEGKIDADWLPEAVAQTARQNDLLVLENGEAIETIETIPTPNGEERHWMVLKFPFTQVDGQRFVGGVAIDITARLEAEWALRVKEQEARSLLDNSPDIVARFDRNLRHVYVNPAAEALRGLPAATLIGKTMADVGVPKEMRALLESQMQQVLANGKESSFEGMATGADGATYHQVRLTPEFDETGVVRTVLVGSRDITRLKQAEKRLSESERRYRRVFESGLGLMCTHDLDGRLLTVNAAAAKSAGYAPEDLVGTFLPDHLTPEARTLFPAYLDRIREGGTDAGLMLIVAKDGRIRTWTYHNALISESGGSEYVLGHAQDVTDLKHAQEEAKNLSLADDLTTLYNRRGLLTLAPQHLKLARRTRRGLVLLYADIDGLKQINDQYGHEEGSKAILRVGEVLRRTFRDTDIIARLGGDEFVALHTNVSPDDVDTIRRRLADSLAEYNHQRDHPFELSLSVGIIFIAPDTTRAIEELLKIADEAMYEEKRRKYRENV
jgi:diguanylate cyclase (GGDEF)-like protein/PAS domain S-box-containing protein